MNKEEKEDLFEDYKERYDRQYDEMNHYEKEKIKYILLSCGGGIATIVPLLLDKNNNIFNTNDLKKLILFFFVIGILNIIILILSQKSLAKNLDIENKIFELKLKNKWSNEIDDIIRNTNNYPRMINCIDNFILLLTVILFCFIIMIFIN